MSRGYCHRLCNHCGYVHAFADREDDREKCPKCDCALDPIAVILTDVGAAAERIERALLEGEALACWTRVDDAGSAEPAVKDIANRLAECAITLPMSRLLHWARTFAQDRQAHQTALTMAKVSGKGIQVYLEAREGLEDAATALEYGCRLCGAQLARPDESRCCGDCAAPTRNLEAAFDERCWAALVTLKEDPKRFNEVTREIVRERPGLTMVEFTERAYRAAGAAGRR